MGFNDEYKKRFFRGDLTGPPRNFEQTVAYNAADRDRNPHRDRATSSREYSPSVDITARFSKATMLRALGCGTGSLAAGLLFNAVFDGFPAWIGIALIVIGNLILFGFFFMLITHLIKMGLSGITGLFSKGWFWRGIAVSVFSGVALALSSASASGFLFGALSGIGIYAAYKIIRHNNRKTD